MGPIVADLNLADIERLLGEASRDLYGWMRNPPGAGRSAFDAQRGADVRVPAGDRRFAVNPFNN